VRKLRRVSLSLTLLLARVDYSKLHIEDEAWRVQTKDINYIVVYYTVVVIVVNYTVVSMPFYGMVGLDF